MERELLSWLSESGAVGGEWTKVGERIIDETLVSELLDSHLSTTTTPSDAAPREERPAIIELSQTPGNLIWKIEDSYTRFLVHCIARYYSLVSFSKLSPATSTTPSRRLTHILRPIVVRPDFLQGTRGIDTPPTTDLSASEISELESASYLGSELDSETGAEEEETTSEADWEDLVVEGERTAAARETLTRSRSGGVMSIGGTSSEDGGRETRESTTDEDEFSEDGEFERDEDQLDSMTSSIASLPPLTPSNRLDNETTGSTTPTPRATTAASSRPSRLSNALFLSSPTPPTTEDGTTTPRGKSSRHRFSRSADSSPSRSPSRGPRPSRLSGGGATGGNGMGISRSEGMGKKRGWELPERSFAEFIFS